MVSLKENFIKEKSTYQNMRFLYLVSTNLNFFFIEVIISKGLMKIELDIKVDNMILYKWVLSVFLIHCTKCALRKFNTTKIEAMWK